MTLFENTTWLVHGCTWDSLGALRPQLHNLRAEAFKLSSTSSPHIVEDAMDQVCTHIIGIDKSTGLIYGAYRARLPSAGSSVSRNLFNLPENNAAFIYDGIELGRAVIGTRYQKSYAALLTLWRGIQRYCDLHGQYTYLYGPVTIDNSFPLPAINVIERYFSRAESTEQLTPIVPRFPLEHRNVADAAELEQTIENADIRSLDRSLQSGYNVRLPILIRQYASFGSRITSFGRWPEFNNAYVTLAILKLADARVELLR